MNLKNRNAIITGANRGLGKAIAEAYLKAGANVLICARDAQLLEETRQELAALLSPDQHLYAQTADVSNQAEVDQLVNVALNHWEQVHILVNNAGVYGPKGTIEEVDWLEWCRAVEINLYSVVLCTRALLPHMREHHYGKIVNLSGGGATNPLPRLTAYAASKAAVIRFMESVAEETRGTGIDVNAVAPGALNTRLLDEVIEAGPEKVGADFHQRMVKIKEAGGVPLEIGANLCVFLATAASDGITGKLISAQWDPWESLPAHLPDIEKSDVYTLRRIVPKDRGLDWGER